MTIAVKVVGDHRLGVFRNRRCGNASESPVSPSQTYTQKTAGIGRQVNLPVLIKVPGDERRGTDNERSRRHGLEHRNAASSGCPGSRGRKGKEEEHTEES